MSCSRALGPAPTTIRTAIRLGCAIGLASLALVSTSPVAAVAGAQAGGGVYFDGLLCEPLGSAQIEVVPNSAGTANRVRIYNLGSSGQDGVEIQWPPASRGASFRWDTASDLGSTGSSHALNMRVRINELEHRLCSLGLINATATTQQIEWDFSDFSSTGGWMVLTGANGEEVHRAPIDVQGSLTVDGGVLAARPAMLNFTCDFGHEGRYQVRYPQPVLVGGIECSAVYFICYSTEPVQWVEQTRLESTVPSGNGEVLIDALGIVPPCAGCPNGPEELGNLVARGDARWGAGGGGGGGAGGALRLENLGSSGQDGVSVVGDPVCCRTSELGIAISDHEQSSAAEPGTVTVVSHGTVGGAVQPIGTLACTVMNDEWDYVPDFSALGASGYRVALYLDGTPVTTQDNPPDGARKWSDGHVTLMKAYDDGEVEYRIVCITHPCPGSPVTLGGTQYLANEIRMTPLSGPGSPPPPPVDDVAGMAVTTVSTSALTITGTSFRSSAPVVGVEDLGDRGVDVGAAWLAPNPTSSGARVVFALPVAAKTRVSVHDVAGREIRVLADRPLAAGAHDLEWDGRDAAGRATPAGLYFVRIDAGARRQVARVTRLE